MSQFKPLIARAGETSQFTDFMGERGVTHLVLLTGNCATHYVEMFNNMVGTAQWQVDRILATSPGAKIGIGFNSDADSLLELNNNEMLHPSFTKMDEVARVSFVLQALCAQFNNRSDGLDIPVAAYLYDGHPSVPDNGRKELQIVKDAGFKTYGSKSVPWNLPHPFGSPLWFAKEVDEYVTIVSPDATQGSIMEAFNRERRISEIGKEVTRESIKAVMDLVANGTVVNLYDSDAIMTYKVEGEVTPILDHSGNLMVIPPKNYMRGDKPHYPNYETQHALRSVPQFKFPELNT